MKEPALLPYQVIQRKRDGLPLSARDLRLILEVYADNGVPDYQMSALLMAIYFRGLNNAELATMVDTMVESGVVVRLPEIPMRKVDKHSTGGVGDKTSLILAPLVASLGVCVPMMSGRGLGHSGGTLDKLESIPGMRTNLSLHEYREQLGRIGCALIGQTDEIAPLDRQLYALRDVTGTVESIPLIASSIMSKKLAEGSEALVLDIKQGSGAFLPERERAEELARLMVEIGAQRGMEVVALLTAMDRPLGYAVGNALEVEECIFALQGAGPPDLRELNLALAAEMLVLGGVAADADSGRALAAAALDDGRALAKMAEIVAAQGGNAAVLEDPALLPQAPVRRAVEAPRAGWIARMDVRAIGMAAVSLGAGRSLLESAIDPAVGFQITAKPGMQVDAGEPMATVYAASAADAEAASAALLAAIEVTDAPPSVAPLPLISHRITKAGIEEWKRSGS